MRKEEVEIFSDATNAAIMRHPNRKFPGVLVQGDTLNSMLKSAEIVLHSLDSNEDLYYEMRDLKEILEGMVSHYKTVLLQHGESLPFYSGNE